MKFEFVSFEELLELNKNIGGTNTPIRIGSTSGDVRHRYRSTEYSGTMYYTLVNNIKGCETELLLDFKENHGGRLPKHNDQEISNQSSEDGKGYCYSITGRRNN